MTVYELLEIHSRLLEVFEAAGVNMSDVKYLDMYREYKVLDREGNKKTYMESFLCQKYRISKSTFYRVIGKFGKSLQWGCGKNPDE